MIFLVLAAYQAVNGLSTELPRDEWLRFTFVRNDRIGHPRVTGASTTVTKWSAPVLLDIVRRCGGQDLIASRDDGRVISVNARSGTGDLPVARCVKESTSLRFRVAIAGRGFASAPYDQGPFRALWDS